MKSRQFIPKKKLNKLETITWYLELSEAFPDEKSLLVGVQKVLHGILVKQSERQREAYNKFLENQSDKAKKKKATRVN